MLNSATTVSSIMNGTTYYYTDSADIEFIFTQGQAQNYPRHMHTRHWTVGVALAGTAALTTDAGIQSLCGGQYFFICPYEPHSLRIAPESSLLVFCFDNIAAFSINNGMFPELPLHIPLLSGQEKLFACTFVQACSENSLHYITACQNSQAPADSLAVRAVQTVILHLLDDPDKFSGIEQMAAYAGYSRWHFLRTFQKCAGMTPHAFQLLCRLRLLRGLLRADTASAAAAASAGFSDQSHMHKVFKRHHGMTPGQFKQANFKLAL